MSNKVFPKYHELICNTYTPDFTAGGGNCVLQTAVLVTKSRLVAGGTFFRSTNDGGAGNVNAIQLELILTPIGGGHSEGELKITNIDGSVDSVLFTQRDGSPCLQNGIDELRNKLNAGSPIYPYAVTMPEDDDEQPWEASTQDADCILTSFGGGSPPLFMSGAVVLPDASSSIRTGPSFTLFHVQTAETGNTGAVTDVNKISEWDGAQWIAHPSELYEAGSGSPALCTP